jgi:NTE family protein
MNQNKDYRVGIALGGGGARGFAHLGVMKALNEKGIYPEILSGVSAGAIAGAFLGSGMTPDEAFGIIKKYTFTGISALNVPRLGFLSLEKMKSNLRRKVPCERLEDLKIPLIVGVTDMLCGEAVYLKEGPLPDIVQASSSIPVIFSPVELNGTLYADGGVLDNLPVKPLVGLCDKIIAISISPVQKIEQMRNLVEVGNRMLQLAVSPSQKRMEKLCDLLIEPPALAKYDITDTKHADEIFEIGYQYAKQVKIEW